MSTRTDLSIAPYFDDYSEDKDFYRILFRPRSVQARELNQMQSILANQIERFGSHIFNEGAMVIPGGVRTFLEQDSISVNFSGSNSTAITSETSEIYLKSNVSNMVARVAKFIPSVDTDPDTFFIDYITTGDTQEKKFVTNEALVAFVYNSDGSTRNIANILVDTPYVSQWAKVQEGVYYIRGMFVKTPDQDIVVSKYTTTASLKVGFIVRESIVTEVQDSSLYSNAIGYPNFNAPGANRLKISLELGTLGLNETNPDFIELLRFVNGEVENKVIYTDYSLLQNALAQRTYETNGNFTVNPFELEIREHLNTGSNGGVYTVDKGGNITKMVAALKPGIAYVLGYRAENSGLQYIPFDKARDTAVLKSSVTSVDYGPYVLATTLSSIPDIDIKKKYTLKDASNNPIGTASIRAVRLQSTGVYRLYLFNIVWNTGKTINNLNKVTYSDASNNFSSVISGTPVLYNSGANSLLFRLPVTAVKTLLEGGTNNTSYVITRSYNVTTNASGVAVVSCASNESFYPVNTNDYMVADTGGTNDGVVYDPNNISLSGTPVGSSITINLGVGNANKTIKVNAPVIKNTPIQKTKTLTTITNEEIVFTAEKKKNLAKADIIKIISIVDTVTSQDITAQFVLDNGQRDSIYTVGSISTLRGDSITKTVHVTYEYFEHSPGDFFSADSYGGLERTYVPKYVSGNNTYSLYDCVDFRPLTNSAGDFTSATVFGDMVKPASTLSADVSYYLPRIDILYVDSSSTFNILRGVPSVNPRVPSTPDNAMKLYEINVPPYTESITDVTLKMIDNKRYTMRDIGKLEGRISNLEYYTTLSALESSVNKTQVIDPVTGNNRFKNGFAVDGFTDFRLIDLTSSEYAASIDMVEGILKPQFVENGVGYPTDTASKTLINSHVNDFIKSYTVTPMISQPYATRTININPYAVFTWVGTVKLSPSTDFWKDVKYANPIVINNTINLRGNAVQGSVWSTWRGFDAVTTRTTTTVFTSSTSTRSTDNVLSTTIIPYQRSIPVRVSLSGFRPFTRLYPFWDGVSVGAYVQQDGKALGDPVITDAAGAAEVTYTIPNTDTVRFRTGTTVMRWTDREDDDRLEVSTDGEAVFVSGGSLDTRQVTTTNTTTLSLRTTTSSSTRRNRRQREGGERDRDPIAQTFKIPLEGGAFIPKIDVFFATKAKAVPVTLEVRTVFAGLPTSDVVASVVLTPDLVNVSDNGTVATSFVFDDPVLLLDTEEYAIVLLADTQEYNVYIAELGQNVIGQNMALSKQPHLGVFLSSSNGSTWNPNQMQDLKFVIHRCVFDTGTTSQITFNSNAPAMIPTDVDSIETTNGSGNVKVRIKSHGLIAGDTVIISGATGGNGLLDTDLNDTFTVLSSDIDSFTVSTGVNATLTGFIGGSSMMVEVNYPFTRFVHNADIFVPDRTSITWEYQYKNQSGRAMSAWIPFELRNDVDIATEGVVSVAGDFKVRATMTTEVNNLTPCIAIAANTTVLVSPRINNDSAKPVYTYVTSPINFNNPSTSATFYVGAKLPNGSNMKFYYKPIDNPDQNLGAVNWVELTPVSPIRNDMKNFIEYQYNLSGIGSFVGYVVKIVLLGSDPVNYPMLSDFRSIALA